MSRVTLLSTSLLLTVSIVGSAEAATISASGSAPTTDLLISQSIDSSFTRLGTAHGSRGNTFSNASSDDWLVEAITVQVDDTAATNSGIPPAATTLTIELVDNALSPTGNESGLTPTLSDSDYLTIALDTPIIVAAGETVGFNLDLTDDDRLQLAISSANSYGGGRLLANGAFVQDWDMTFFVQGTVVTVPEPKSFLLIVVSVFGGMLLVVRGRRSK